jgi:signal transduction histidine kinase
MRLFSAKFFFFDWFARSSRRVIARSNVRRHIGFTQDRLARRLAFLTFAASVAVSILAGFVSLAVEDTALRRDAETGVRDQMAVAVEALKAPDLTSERRRAIVASLAKSESAAWARIETRLPDGQTEILSADDDAEAILFELEMAISAPSALLGSVLVVGVDGRKVEERLKKGFVRELVTNFFITLAGAAAVFVVFQSSVTRHVERVTNILEEASRFRGTRREPVFLDRKLASRNDGASLDTLDRLAQAASTLLDQTTRTTYELQRSADELELRVSERTAAADHERSRFQDVVMSSSDWVFETDAKGRFAFLDGHGGSNELGAWMSGSVSNLQLSSAASHGQQRAFRNVMSAFARFEAVRNQPIRVVGPAGDDRWIVVNATPIFATSAGGVPMGMRGCLADVTELYEARARAQRGERMAEIGQMVAGVAHEINTPAGCALTFASSIEETLNDLRAKSGGRIAGIDEDTASDICEAAAGIVRNLTRVSRIVASFKAVVVDQASEQRRRFELAAYLDDVGTALAPEWRKKGQRRLVVSAPPGLVLDSYPGAIAQIFTNLVTNGLAHAFADFEPGIGTMTISVQHLVAKPGWIEIVYSDDGAGADAKTLAHIFEPFFTTRRASGGTGLGLSIVHSLVTDVLGGDIGAESAEGAGFRISIKIPTSAPTQAVQEALS